VGGYVILFSGGTNYVRKILANSAGVWKTKNSNKTRLLDIRIDADGTEPASGVIHILWPQISAVAWGVADYRYFRVRFASLSQGSGSPGYLGCSKAIVGPFIPFGMQYSRGRVVSQTQIQRLTEQPGGQRQALQLAKPRRIFEFQWTDPVVSTQLYAASPSPDYVAAVASGVGLAFRRDLHTVEGILRRQRGAQYPVVMLPDISYSAGSSTIVGAERQLYGRILTETTSRTSVVGNEALNEASTIGTLRIEEEV
jgi:hypothetical protein